MKDSVGNIFNAFSSSLTINETQISNLTLSQRLFYLFQSNATLSRVTMMDAVMGDEGSFITASSQSIVNLTSLLLKGVVATDHGLIVLQKSSLQLTSSVVANLNVSYIVASQSSICIGFFFLACISAKDKY